MRFSSFYLLCLVFPSLIALIAAQLGSAPIPAAQLAPYPPMHWHSWNTFCGEGKVNDENMREMAQALLSSGMAAAGYDMVNVVCQGWGPRDPVTKELTQDKTKWPEGMKGLADYLHAQSPPLKMGCYTSPAEKNCCGEPGSLGYEYLDMEFFAQQGCDHVMVDWCRAYTTPYEMALEFGLIGEAIANSSNPNMMYSIWPTGFGKSWKWSTNAGGHFFRVETDISNSWDIGYPPNQPGSVIHNFDTAMSIPEINTYTVPGRYMFLDSLVVDIKPWSGGALGPGLTYEEQRSHMTMWVIAASPLLACNDIRAMTNETKELLMNEEVLAVHKDPLVKMGVRIDIGGGVNEPHTNYHTLGLGYQVYAKPLVDGSTAVMILNRDVANANITVALEDIGDCFDLKYNIRDLWLHQNLTDVVQMVVMGVPSWPVPALVLEVPAHGVRFLRMWPLV